MLHFLLVLSSEIFFPGTIKGDRDLSFVGTAKERIENELALDYRSLRPSEIN